MDTILKDVATRAKEYESTNNARKEYKGQSQKSGLLLTTMISAE